MCVVVPVRLWGCDFAIFCYMLQFIGLCDDMAVDKVPRYYVSAVTYGLACNPPNEITHQGHICSCGREIRRSKSFQNFVGLGMRYKSRALLIGHRELDLIWSSTYCT